MTESQNRQILKALQRGQKLTAFDALNDFQCLRLASRVHDIKRMGYPVRVEMITTNTNKTIAQYSLPPYARHASFQAIKEHETQMRQMRQTAK